MFGSGTNHKMGGVAAPPVITKVVYLTSLGYLYTPHQENKAVEHNQAVIRFVTEIPILINLV